MLNTTSWKQERPKSSTFPPHGHQVAVYLYRDILCSAKIAVYLRKPFSGCTCKTASTDSRVLLHSAQTDTTEFSLFSKIQRGKKWWSFWENERKLLGWETSEDWFKGKWYSQGTKNSKHLINTWMELTSESRSADLKLEACSVYHYRKITCFLCHTKGE